MNAIESKLKSKRATGSDVVVVLSSVVNIPLTTVTSTTRWTFEAQSDRISKARQDVLGWRQKKHGIDYEITFVCRFDLLVIASAKRVVNIPDVQNVLSS